MLGLMKKKVVLFLNYSNAAVSLPQAIARPDPDFLVATLAMGMSKLCPNVRRQVGHRPG